MNIILLGCSGYIGRRLLPELLKNSSVTCICRNAEKFSSSIPLNYCNQNMLNIIDDAEKSLMSYFEKVKQKNEKIDWVVNLSCAYMKTGENNVWMGNYVFPGKVICIMQEKRILNSVLTIGTGLPENFNLYCFCKKQFYDLCAFNNKINKKVVINVKLENFYGEDEPRDRFLPWVIEKLKKDEDVELTEGYQHRDFIYAEDVVNALLCVLKYYSNCNTGENIEIPLGTGTAPSIREVVEYCKSECNSNSRLLFGAVPLRWNEPDSVADIKKLNEIGFRPEYQWREGMKLMIERFIK